MKMSVYYFAFNFSFVMCVNKITEIHFLNTLIFKVIASKRLLSFPTQAPMLLSTVHCDSNAGQLASSVSPDNLLFDFCFLRQGLCVVLAVL